MAKNPPEIPTDPNPKDPESNTVKTPLRDALLSTQTEASQEFFENLLRNLSATTHVHSLSPMVAGLTGTFLTLDEPSLTKHRQLESEMSRLRDAIQEQTQALQREKQTAEQRKRDIEKLSKTVDELNQKARLGFLLNCVNQDGQRALLQSEDFQRRFLEPEEPTAFVMSIDIRRSTELMLKARSPEDFASFITDLCKRLMEIIMNSYGVIDKFTGDGVLAYFPEFYTGDAAAYYAIAAAEECHNAFSSHYRTSRRSFKSILTDVGLGIGIDYGKVHLVQIAGGLTVVGEPVVYACRLSGAPAGLTLLNQPAYDEITDKFGKYCLAKETKLEIKHEGTILGYAVNLNSKKYKPIVPDWVNTALDTPRP